MAETLCGSPLYMAPEILRFQKYDAKADLWSVGTIMFEMLVGKPPFTGANQIQLLSNIERNEFKFPERLKLSPEGHEILKCLLRRDPKERIEFEAFFKLPFLKPDPNAQDQKQTLQQQQQLPMVSPVMAPMQSPSPSGTPSPAASVLRIISGAAYRNETHYP